MSEAVVPKTTSPFLAIPATAHVATNPLAFAVRDKYPVTPGHTLVIPRRVMPTWWDATAEEQQAILTLVDQVRADLLDDITRTQHLPGTPRPEGFNVGFNAGDVAGQTVNHLHMHVIPRYRGDMADPRGGVRHVIPEKGNYLTPRAFDPRLHDSPARPLRDALLDASSKPAYNTAAVAASFVMSSGLRVLDPVLDSILARDGSSVRLITTDYLGVTEKSALQTLLQRQREYGGRLKVRVFQAGATSFHPKAYILSDSSTASNGVVFVGSSNASQYGLVDGHEWTLESEAPATVVEAIERFDLIWHDTRSRDLNPELIDSYVEAVRPKRGSIAPPIPLVSDAPTEVEPPTQPIAPTEVQRDALDALELTRLQGFGGGLVVMATGLGKTWLAAFDSARPEYRRVLFVAHREEILDQARAVFRKVQPDATIGSLSGGVEELDADIVMASIQTLTRRVDKIASDAFDYVIVDEFHHASAGSYRKVIAALDPHFMLGLTATPQRTDRADLLALCEDNLVFECGLTEGINRGLLVPFRYHGVEDSIDFEPLPWRSGRFDPTELENAVITQARTEAAYREWSTRRGSRTLAFCVSKRHADWMCEAFSKKGIRAVSIHSGSTSAPRQQSLTDLRNGSIDVIFSVDFFNEGTDVPEIDTILMLRPTTSPGLFVQQIGRGLRKSEGKHAVTIVDFVGNHKSFKVAARTLASLGQSDLSDPALRGVVESGKFLLPDDCSVDYTLEAKENILDLLPASLHTTRINFARSWSDERGDRPTAMESYLAGINPSGARPGWFGELDEQGLLSQDEMRVLERHSALLDDIATTKMQKSYKMVTIRALLLTGSMGAGAEMSKLATACYQLIAKDPRLRADLSAQEVASFEHMSLSQWQSYWERFPIKYLQTGGQFELRDNIFSLVRPPTSEDVATLEAMVNELCEWRLAAYLDRHELDQTLLQVHLDKHTPILRLNRAKHPEMPRGRGIPVRVGQELLLLDFARDAVRVASREAGGPNILTDLTREWFGDEVNSVSTNSYVELAIENDEWHLSPYRPRAPHTQLKLAT